jgi:hypothetical protein
VIAFTREQRFGFQVGDIIFSGTELAVELFEQIVALLGVGFFLREMNVGIQIAGERSELFVGGNLILGALTIAQERLRGFLIVPEIGRRDPRFEGFQAFAVRRGVKDSSERA